MFAQMFEHLFLLFANICAILFSSHVIKPSPSPHPNGHRVGAVREPPAFRFSFITHYSSLITILRAGTQLNNRIDTALSFHSYIIPRPCLVAAVLPFKSCASLKTPCRRLESRRQRQQLTPALALSFPQSSALSPCLSLVPRTSSLVPSNSFALAPALC
jgi:hypothetical protein